MPKYIPDDPKQRNALFVGIVFLLLLYPFYAFYYKGQKAQAQALQSHLSTLQNLNRAAQVLAARGGGDLAKNMALYDRQVKKLEQLIPSQEEVPGLLDDISEVAQRVGVKIEGFSPEPSEAGAFYTKESFDLSVVGEYQPVGEFLAQIASLPRIVTPVEMDIEKFDQPQLFPDMDNPIVAKFRIETYVLPSPAGGPASGTPKKAGA